MKLSGASGRTWLFILTVMVGTLIFVGIPQVALGSTYPPTPEVIMSVSSTAISPDSEAVISVEWHRHMILQAVPPETILVSAYRISDGTPVATYAIARDTAKAAPDGDVWHYRGVLRSEELPAGELMLIATDPLSGAFSRLPIQVQEKGRLFTNVQVHAKIELLDYGVIGFFSSLILFALILLVKDDNKAIS
jgi:hypothetical protein